MLPGIFGDSLFDDWMSFPFRSGEGAERREADRTAVGLMKTDVIERENEYELAVELPGYKKDQIELQLNGGYLTITARRAAAENTDKQGRMLRRERYLGAMRRSFHVGSSLREEEVKARFEDGVLTLTIPKETARKAEPRRTIQIEG